MTDRTSVVVTGSGAVCAAGMTPDEMLDAILAGRSSIGPIARWDTTGWPCRIAAEIADFNPRALVDDRKLHKLIRRTDLVGLYAAGRAIERSGIVAHRDALAPGDAAVYSDRTGVYVGLRRRQLREPVRLFPAVRGGRRRAARVRPRAREHREPDVAPADAAEQRARPHRHQARAEGRQRVHHQPQLRRHARDHRSLRGVAQRRGRPRGRRRARNADRAADGALLPAARPARDRDAAAVRRAPRRQPVRRGRGRAAARDRGLGASPERDGAGRNSRRRLRVRGRRAGRDPRRRRRPLARDRRGAARRRSSSRPPSA